MEIQTAIKKLRLRNQKPSWCTVKLSCMLIQFLPSLIPTKSVHLDSLNPPNTRIIDIISSSCPARVTFLSSSLLVSNPFNYSYPSSINLPLMAPENHQQESRNSILVTGGAGFIGTHTVLQLLNEGYRVSIIDNLDNSVEDAVDRVRDLAGSSRSGNLQFHVGDLRNKEDLEKVFSQTRFDAVIHFAGLKAVGESVAKPSLYYNNNLIGTLNLFEFMTKYGCKKMVFSSSATVYGQPETIPCVEDFQLMAMNPYGRTKLFLEEIARDIQKADPEWRIILLRYFNPVGADMSGQIGEDPKGIPNNLMPYIQQVAVGRLPVLNVFGYDYPTKDGSAIRDYIHVVDLADGHIAALRKIFSKDDIGCVAYNLGTGCGTSVLEMVAAFEKASGKKIPVKLCPRRPGDATAVYASTEKAKKELGWKAKYGVEEMCRDQWNWARKNPWGYRPQQ